MKTEEVGNYNIVLYTKQPHSSIESTCTNYLSPSNLTKLIIDVAYRCSIVPSIVQLSYGVCFDERRMHDNQVQQTVSKRMLYSRPRSWTPIKEASYLSPSGLVPVIIELGVFSMSTGNVINISGIHTTSSTKSVVQYSTVLYLAYSTPMELMQ